MSNARMTREEFHAIPPSKARSVREVGEAALAKREGGNGQQGQRAPQWNKYGAKKVKTEEGVFDSQIEYKRWCELKLLQSAGQINHLQRQIPFTLEVNGQKICRFTIDHKWFDPVADCWCYEDVKGVLVRDFMLRVKLMKALHSIDVQVWPERRRKAKKRSAK